MDFLLTYGLGRMKHFSFVYFSMLLHDSEEGCSHFVLEGLISLVEDGLSPDRDITMPPVFSLVTWLFQTVALRRREETETQFNGAEGSSTVD